MAYPPPVQRRRRVAHLVDLARSAARALSGLAAWAWPLVRIAAVVLALYYFRGLVHRADQVVSQVYTLRAETGRRLVEARTYYGVADNTAASIQRYHKARQARRPRGRPARPAAPAKINSNQEAER